MTFGHFSHIFIPSEGTDFLVLLVHKDFLEILSSYMYFYDATEGKRVRKGLENWSKLTDTCYLGTLLVYVGYLAIPAP